jgi:Rha family phage regulatory protein
MSTEIIRFDNQQVKGMTSLQIAEVTGKNHKEVLRDIRNILERGASERNFALTSYNDKQGKERPMFNLTPKGCLILASGYDVVLREKIIDKLEDFIDELIIHIAEGSEKEVKNLTKELDDLIDSVKDY